MLRSHYQRFIYLTFLFSSLLPLHANSTCVSGVYSDLLLDGGTSYSDNNGSLLFTSNWIETDSLGGGSTSGNVDRANNTIAMRRTSGDSAVEREMDFTGVGTAEIIFDEWSQNTEAGDTTYFQISYDGGSSWTTLDSHTGYTSWDMRKITINSPTQSANTRFRFYQPSGYTGFNENYQFATFQVKITCQTQTATGSLSSASVFETGQATLNNTASSNSWVTVNLTQTYSSPPRIFAMANTSSGSADPFALRIRNVTTTSFEVSQFEPPGENGSHPSSVIDYYAFEEGIHTLSDGTEIEVGSYSTSKFASRQVSGASQDFVNFSTLFSSPPIVLSQIQTVNNEPGILPGSVSSPWMTAMVQHIVESGFSGAIERTEVNNGSITSAETIAYLAILPGSSGSFVDGTGTTITYEAQSSGGSPVFGWDDGCTNYSFIESYSSNPLVVGHMNSRDSGDGGWIRRCNLSTSQVGLLIDEDQDHASERGTRDGDMGGFLVFSGPVQTTGAATRSAYFDFEDSSWDGSLNDVQDSSGNGLHLMSINSPAQDNSSPAISGDPGTCDYVTFDGTHRYMTRSVSAGDGFLDGEYTVAMWVNVDPAFTYDWGPIAGRFTADESQNDWTLVRAWNTDFLHIIHDEGGARTDFYTNISISSLMGSWHHIAFTFDGTTAVSYLDGVQVASQAMGPLSSSNGYFTIGRDRGTGPTGFFLGDIDEFYVYDGALDASDIAALRTATHACPMSCGSTETIPISFGSSWDVANGIIDIDTPGVDSRTFTTTNGFQYDVSVNNSTGVSGYRVLDGVPSGRIMNGTLSVSITETVTGLPLAVEGVDMYINDLEQPFYNEAVSSFFYIDENGTTVESAPAWTGWVDINGDAPGSGYLFVNGSGQLQATYSAAFDGQDNKYARLSNSTDIRWSTISISETGFGPVYLGVSPVASAQACFSTATPFVVDHFEITPVTSPGSTCSGTELKITACQDSATPCTPLTAYTDLINISTTSIHGNWAGSTTNVPNGTLTDSTPDDGYASYQFTSADNGVVYLVLDNSHADDLNVVVGDMVAMVSGTSSTITFRDNSFVLTPTVINSPAGKDIAITAEVWKNDGASCGIATEYSGTVPLKTWVTRTAAMPSGTLPSLDGVNLPSSEPGSNNLTLTFVNGVASATLATFDVGQYALNFLDDTSGFAMDLSGIRNITGASADLTVTPFGFDIHTNNDPDAANSLATSASGSVFKTAGDNFTVTVRAVAWESADDSNNDGIPDAGSNLGNNASVINFGQETTAETVDISHALNLPSGGQAGTLTGGSAVGGFVNGSRQVSVSYNEVGIIDLSVALSDGSYLGAGDANGSVAQIGRFIPAEFVVSGPLLTDACTVAGNYSYMGEVFSFNFDFEAVNRSGIRTQNYDGSFEKFNVNSSSDFNIRGTQAAPSYTNLTSRLTEDSWAGNFSQGQGDVTASYLLNRGASPDGPYDMNVSFILTDSDGVSLNSLNVDSDNNSSNDRRLIGSSQQRYGRLIVENNFGSGLQDLSMAISSEYYGMLGVNPGFVSNSDDLCTTIVAGDVSFSNYTDSLSSGETTASIGSWSAGTGVISLSAPGSGNNGGVEVHLDVPSWLEYDHKGAGVTDPTGFAAFGIRNDVRNNMIYMREVVR